MTKDSKIKNIFIHSLYAIAIGIIAGFACGLLGQGVKLATEFRNNNTWLIYLLPIAGILIILIYRILKVDLGYKTNNVINTIVNKDEGICLQIAPAIFLATILTHLFGGSAGKESAGILVGTSIACFISRKIKVVTSDIRIITMCGMAAGFSALFGTPLAATVFSIEIIASEVDLIAIIPVLISSFVGKYAGALVYANNETYLLSNIPQYTLSSFVRILFVTILASAVSLIMIYSLENFGELFKKIKNDYLRIIVGGIIVSISIMLLGANTYAGAGLNVIEQAIEGYSISYSFIIKIVLTSITLAAGFKGGEIVPTLFIGATFGATIGPVFGLDAGFSAAISMICLFAANTNCPVASFLLALELFGTKGIIFFIPATLVSYLLTSNFGLYSNTKAIIKTPNK